MGVITVVGFFYFDHIHPEVCEQHRRGWPHEDAREIKDVHAL